MAITERQSEMPHLNFDATGELSAGVNIEFELERAMEDHGGTLQYWKPGAEVGAAEGFDRTYFETKMQAAIDIAKAKGVPITEQEVSDTYAFVDEMFGVYEGTQAPYRNGGTFAFVAATRLQRRAPGEFSAWDYRKEITGCFPALKHLDERSAQRVMVGMAPFVLDYYGDQHSSEGGVMIFSPLFLDLKNDTGDKFAEIGINVAQETSWFAQERVGVQLMSLAALLPKHTFYGELFKRDGIRTTTGHGGTTWLIGETAYRTVSEGRVDPRLAHKVGILGVGGIGLATADLVLSQHNDIQIAINDYDTHRQAEVSERLRAAYGDNRVVDMHTAKDVLLFGGTTLSAITRPIDLDDLGLNPDALVGRAYVDDSQPAAVSADQVVKYGGLHVGVIGQDGPEGKVTSTRFNYGEQGPYGRNHQYGCALEGAAQFHYGSPDDAITAPVLGDHARRAGEYMSDMGITAAPLQTLINGKAQLV